MREQILLPFQNLSRIKAIKNSFKRMLLLKEFFYFLLWQILPECTL